MVVRNALKNTKSGILYLKPVESWVSLIFRRFRRLLRFWRLPSILASNLSASSRWSLSASNCCCLLVASSSARAWNWKVAWETDIFSDFKQGIQATVETERFMWLLIWRTSEIRSQLLLGFCYDFGVTIWRQNCQSFTQKSSQET